MTLFAGWLLLSALITLGIFGLIFNHCAGKLNKKADADMAKLLNDKLLKFKVNEKVVFARLAENGVVYKFRNNLFTLGEEYLVLESLNEYGNIGVICNEGTIWYMPESCFNSVTPNKEEGIEKQS